MESANDLAERLRASALSGQGVTAVELRQQIHERAVRVARGGIPPDDSLPPQLARFVDAVAERPGSTDIEGLLAAGHSEDEVFECAVVSAVASGLVRLEEGVRALDES